MNNMETWITTDSVFRINFGNKSRSSPDTFEESAEKYDQVWYQNKPESGVHGIFDVLPHEQQEHFDKGTHFSTVAEHRKALRKLIYIS